jgi:hypothetical protein
MIVNCSPKGFHKMKYSESAQVNALAKDNKCLRELGAQFEAIALNLMEELIKPTMGEIEREQVKALLKDLRRQWDELNK